MITPAMLLLSLAALTALLPGLIHAAAYEPLRLRHCPQGDVTLDVPENLPLGAVLFTWDPARLTLRSGLQAYKRNLGRVLHRASPAARAFFAPGGAPSSSSGGPGTGLDEFFELSQLEPAATLARDLWTGAARYVRGRFHLTCEPAEAATAAATTGTAAPRSRFLVHLRLLRNPLAPAHLWRRPLSRFIELSGAPPGSTLRLSLRSLLARPAARVRLLPDSASGNFSSSTVQLTRDSLLLSLRSQLPEALTVSLEATDTAGHTEVANLTLLAEAHWLGRRGLLPLWRLSAPLLAGALAFSLLLLLAAACAAASCCLRCCLLRRRRSARVCSADTKMDADVKPAFV